MEHQELERQDALSEAISRQLFRINRVVKELFGQELTDDEIKRAHGRISQGVSQALRQQGTPGGAQPQLGYAPLPQPAPRINPADLAEGGLINDASGEDTAYERARLGIR